MFTLQNKFGLVYQGALTENISWQVNIHNVTYKNINWIEISANVYTPANYDSEKKYPAIVVAHPNGGVKEQVAGLFAQKLAENGYITIAADASYQGASGGEPRQTDHPSNRVEDVHAMVDYISTYPGVDTKRIGALGICGGGGYTIQAVKTDKRVKAVATISMFNTGRVRRNGFLDADMNTISERLQKAVEARDKELKGEVEYSGSHIPERLNLSEEELEKIPAGLYRDGTVYYRMTHFHPNSTPHYTTSSLMYLMAFDAENQVELITQPLLMIAGKDADTRYMTDDVFEKLVNAKNKELFLIDGATHIETYWKEPYVTQEAEKLVEFFWKNL